MEWVCVNTLKWQRKYEDKSVLSITTYHGYRYIIFCTRDNIVRMWDVNNDVVHKIEGAETHIQSVAMLVNNIVFVTRNNTVKVWGKNEPIKTRENYGFGIRSLKVLGHSVVFAELEDVKIWDTINDKCTDLQGHSRFVNCVDVFSDGRIVSGSQDKTVKIWENKNDSWTCVQTLKGHGSHVDCVAVFGGRVASSSNVYNRGNEVYIWDVDTGEYHELNFLSSVFALHWFKDMLVIGLSDFTMQIWEENEGSWIKKHVLRGHTDSVDSITTFGNKLVSGAKTVKIWELKDTMTPAVKLGYKTFPSGTRLFTLITSETFDRTRDLAFFGKHLGLNVRATLHNTSESGYVWLHVFNTTGPLRMLTAPNHWRQAIFGTEYIALAEVERRLIRHCKKNGYDGWHMRVKMDNRGSNVKDAEYETVVLKSSFDKLQFRGKKRITLEDLKDKDHVRVSKNGKITFVKRIERLEEMFENLRF